MKWWPQKRNETRTEPANGSDWVVRMRSGALANHERRTMSQWIKSSPENARDLLRSEAAWRLSGAIISDEAVQRELEQLDRLPGAVAGGPHGERQSGHGMWRLGLRSVGVAAAAVCALGLLVWFVSASRNSYETARGEQRVVTLADGSIVALNTATELQVDFSTTAREIVLRRGEALFQVTHDPKRPFIVRAGGGYARAIGTRFNVLTQENAITVSVLEGQVEVASLGGSGSTESGRRESSSSDGVDSNLRSGAGASVGSSSDSEAGASFDPSSASRSGLGRKMLLQAGQSAAYAPGGEFVSPEPVQVSAERIIAWREGKLRFESWRLDRAVREYNRYAKKPIRLESPEFAGVEISGVFRIGDSTAFVTALGELVDARVVDAGDALVLTDTRVEGGARR